MDPGILARGGGGGGGAKSSSDKVLFLLFLVLNLFYSFKERVQWFINA